MSLYATQWATGQKVRPTVLGFQLLETKIIDIERECDVCFQPIEKNTSCVYLAFGRYHPDCVDWT